ncbi:MAG: hypothetical protein GY797_18685 [Deltaproteobacteria bacterium]|nr:hypothetical protein [Deltaproteobacteria bacterium]
MSEVVFWKKGRAISPRGFIFKDTNIGRLLQQRHISHEARKAGVRLKGPKKRSAEDETRFRRNFARLLDEC